MRKIAKDAARAIREGRNWASKNTSVHIKANGHASVRLHGNLILETCPSGIGVCLAGWPTTTTRSRINDLLSALGVPGRVFQHREQQFARIGRSEPVEIDARDVVLFGHDNTLTIL